MKKALFIIGLFSMAYACSSSKSGKPVAYEDLISSMQYEGERVSLDGYIEWKEGDIWQTIGRKQNVSLKTTMEAQPILLMML